MNPFEKTERTKNLNNKNEDKRTFEENYTFCSGSVTQYGGLGTTIVGHDNDQIQAGHENRLVNVEHQRYRFPSEDETFVKVRVTSPCEIQTDRSYAESSGTNDSEDTSFVDADEDIYDDQESYDIIRTEEIENSGTETSIYTSLEINLQSTSTEHIISDQSSGDIIIQQHNSNSQNDGRISAIVIALFIMSWGVVFMVSKMFREDEQNDVTSPLNNTEEKRYNLYSNDSDIDTVDAVELFLIFLNTIGIFSYIYQAYQNGETNNEIDGDRNLKIIFLWIFSFLSIVYFTFEIVSDSSCESCLKKTNGILILIFRITLIILFVVQLIYLHHYANHRFQLSCSVNFMYVFMFTSVCSVWFHHLMSETGHTLQKHQNTKCNCLPENSTFRTSMDHVLTPIFQPIVIESTLLSLEILLVMWSSSVALARRNQRFEESNHNAIRTVEAVPRFRLCIQAITLVLNAPNVVFIVMFLTVNSFKDVVNTACECYAAAYKIILVIGIFVAYKKLNTECDRIPLTKTFKGQDIVFLVSAFFAMMLHGFELYATIIHNKRNILYWGNIVECTFDYIIDIFQTHFLVQIRAYKLKDGYGEGLSGAFCFLYISNGFLWAVYSFSLVMSITVSQIPSQVYGDTNWGNLFHTLLPFCCFYRFHAFYAFYRLTKQFKPCRQIGNN